NMEYAALIARQREFFRSGRTLDADERRRNLRALLKAVEANEQILLESLHADLRKSAHDAFASELGMVTGEIRHALKHLSSWASEKKIRESWMAWPSSSCVRAEPMGVALIIGPWNYPLQLLLGPLVGAIAAGNCAVLKPSEFAPHTAAAIARLIGEIFPPEFISVVQGDETTAAGLLREKFDTIFFTGSTRVGREVMSAAAKHLTPVTLELGGKCPTIVCVDADVEITARRIVWGKFLNAGQTCVAPNHVWVDRRIERELIAAITKAIGEFFGNDPQRSAAYGRIINRRHFDRLCALLDSAHIECGGARDAEDLYLAPTVVSQLADNTPLLAEEIFGPVLPLRAFDDLDQVIASERAQPVPLAMYAFTHDRKIQDRLLNEIRSGGACINDTLMHLIGRELPFGGLGESGMGASHGKASFDAFSHRRSIMRRPFKPDPAMRYPPQRVGFAAFKRILRFFGAA
ncbi:MAG: aldehyde dehydrogenase family protein, partial [Verrucomicrobiota bacterium]